MIFICLARMATGKSWYCLIPGNFGVGLTCWSEGFQWLVDFIFLKLYHKIYGNSVEMRVGQMSQFRKVLYTKSTSHQCELETLVNVGDIDHELGLFMDDIVFEDFFPAMLLDNTSVTNCRHGSGPFGDYSIPPHQFFQRDFYSGYFHEHGLKFEVLLLPNGKYGSVWGTNHSYNNIFIFNVSGIGDYLHDILENCEDGYLHYCALVDGIFTESVVIMTTKVHLGANEDAVCLMRRLAFIRQPIELQYGPFYHVLSFHTSIIF